MDRPPTIYQNSSARTSLSKKRKKGEVHLSSASSFQHAEVPPFLLRHLKGEMLTLAVSTPKTSPGNTHKDIEQNIWNFVVQIVDRNMKYYVLINTKEDQRKEKPYQAISPLKPFDCPAMRREGYQCSLEDSPIMSV